jgi:hypothetical protein
MATATTANAMPACLVLRKFYLTSKAASVSVSYGIYAFYIENFFDCFYCRTSVGARRWVGFTPFTVHEGP